MGVRNNPEKCCYCGGCVGSCPTMALELKETRIAVYNDKCIDCCNCIKICPVGAMEKI